jgi:hypothetical protein
MGNRFIGVRMALFLLSDFQRGCGELVEASTEPLSAPIAVLYFAIHCGMRALPKPDLARFGAGNGWVQPFSVIDRSTAESADPMSDNWRDHYQSSPHSTRAFRAV